MNTFNTVLTALLLLLTTQTLYAHQSSVSFLQIDAPTAQKNGSMTARWKIAVLDVELAIGLDDDQNDAITWGEIKANAERISNFAKASIKIQQNELDCSMIQKDLMIEALNSGVYIVADLQFSCLNVDPTPMTLIYQPMQNLDSSHKGVINFKMLKEDRVFVLDQNKFTSKLSNESDQGLASFIRFLLQGIWHIAIGVDHILFLLALLLSSVIHVRNRQLQFNNRLMPIISDVIKIVTVFTVAHSISLIAASMQWIDLPTRFVETTIAVSVALGGFMILFPIQNKYRLMLVFSFGLIHGFGFANVLRDLLVSQQTLMLGTLGFNIGVEIGQLMIVLLALPVFYFGTRYYWYKARFIPITAIAIVFIGAFWAVERSLM